MPRLESDAAGNTPRTASSALALVACLNTKSETFDSRFTVLRTCSVTDSTIVEYESNILSISPTYLVPNGPFKMSASR